MSGDDKDDDWQAFKALTTPLKKRSSFCHSPLYKPPKLVEAPCKVCRPTVVSPSSMSVTLDVAPKQRRRLQPEKSLDLHGLTKDQAYTHLVRFIEFSFYHQRKVVLVITGKGSLKSVSHEEPATLRACLPLWVKASPLNQWVHGLSVARPEHGGEGSFYLVLRKP